MTATPPRADLRTLAAEPFWAVAPPALSANADPRLLDLLAHALEAGVAAVLPEHRRMVLTEAVDFLDDEWPPGAHGGVLEHAADLLRVLADAAPPAGLSAPVPAEPAPAVPEEADGQRGGGGGFRLKRRTDAERADYLSQKLIEIMAERDDALVDRNRLWAELQRVHAQVAHYQRVVEAAKAWRDARPGPWVSGADVEFQLFAAVDALSDVGPHQHECACNRNWGGPCGPCVCEEPPRQGVWRLTCGAGNVPPSQTYATKGAAEDVRRLHGGACPGAHAVEFVPDAGTIRLPAKEGTVT